MPAGGRAARAGGAGGPDAVLLAGEFVHISGEGGFEGTLFSQPRLYPKMQNSETPLSERGLITSGSVGGEDCDPRAVFWGRQPNLLDPLRGRGVSWEQDASWALSLC